VTVVGEALDIVRRVDSDSLLINFPRGAGLVSLVGDVLRLSSLSFSGVSAFSSLFQLPPTRTDVARWSMLIDGDLVLPDRSRLGELSEEGKRSALGVVSLPSLVGVEGCGLASIG
jgi:hypothetical protein